MLPVVAKGEGSKDWDKGVLGVILRVRWRCLPGDLAEK